MSDSPLIDHPHFTPWTDPTSGVTSFVLKHVVGDLQRAWYFVTPSLGSSGHLWFYAAHLPSRRYHSATVNLDPSNPEVVPMPATWVAVDSGNPMLESDGSIAYIPIEDRIYRFDMKDPNNPEEVFRLPKDIIKGRRLYRLVTNLTSTSDGKYWILDSWIGNQWHLGKVDRATGTYELMSTFGHNHHHAISSLHDPNLFIINQGHWMDPVTGFKTQMQLRIWVMSVDGNIYRPIDPDLCFNRNGNQACHEWWSPQGKIQYCHYQKGIIEQDATDPSTAQLIWDRPSTHGMCSPCGRYLVCDVNPYTWNERKPCQVHFKDLQSGKEIPIVAHMPPHNVDWCDVRTYHIDPHPHFSSDGKYVIFTSSLLGKPSVTLTPVSELLQKLEVPA